jgi:hypothetical protein
MIEGIEKVVFRLGEKIRLVLNPIQKGQITTIKLFADGGCQYEVDYLNAEGEIRTGGFFACELEKDIDG